MQDLENITMAVGQSNLDIAEKSKVLKTLSDLRPEKAPQKRKATWLNNNVASFLAIVVVGAAVATWFPIGITIPIEMAGYINSALILVLSYFFGSSVREYNSRYDSSQVSGE